MLLSFWEISKKFRISDENFSAGLWKVLSTCPKDQFEKIFWKMRSDTFYQPRILSKPFSAVSRRCSSRVVKNALYVCKFSRRNNCLKKLINFLYFSNIGRKVFDVVSFLGRFLKTELYVSTGTLLKKNSWKIAEDFLNLFQTSNEKTSAFCQISVSMGWSKVYFTRPYELFDETYIQKMI